MKRLWMPCLWAWMLVCLSYATALAQSDDLTVPFCGRLDATECAVLDASAESMAALTSGTSDTRTEIYLAGGPVGDQDLALRLSTTRTFVIEPAALARLLEMKAMPPEAFEADPALVTELRLLPLSFDTDETTTFAFSPELQARLSTALGREIPAELAFHMRVVDRVLYIRLADFAVFGLQSGWAPEWLGIELTHWFTDTIAGVTTDSDFDVQEAQAELVPPGATFPLAVVYHIPPEQTAEYADFMQLTSRGATEIEGQAANSYRLIWDIPRYLGGPLYAQATGIGAGQSHPNATSRLMGALASVLLHGLLAEARQVIGMEEAHLYELETIVEWQIGIAGGALLENRPIVGYTSTTINRDLNAVVEIPVPEGAIVPPINYVIQSIRFMFR